MGNDLDVARTELEEALEDVAIRQSLCTYTDLVASIRSVALEPRSPELVRLLCERMVVDLQEERPLLSSLVVGRRTNRPGRGFFEFARRYVRIDDDDAFWLAEVTSSHGYYRRTRGRRQGVEVPVRHHVAAATSAQSSPLMDLSDKDFILSFFD